MTLRSVIGFHACREALKVRDSKEIKAFYLKLKWEDCPNLRELFDLAKSKGLKPQFISKKKMDQIGDTHQGVCLLTSAYPQFHINSLGPHSVILILDRIQDPKNLGAIVRSSWLMGVDAIFISSRRSVGITASVAKTASGGLEHIPIEKKGDLSNLIKLLKKEGFWFYVLDSQSKHNLWKEKFEGRVAFVLGGERSGVRKNLKDLCDKSLSIFQTDKSASYNVSVATSLVLGEYSRQRLLYV